VTGTRQTRRINPLLAVAGVGFAASVRSGQGQIFRLFTANPAVGNDAYATEPHTSLFVADIEQAVATVNARTGDQLHVAEGLDQAICLKDPAGSTIELSRDPNRGAIKYRWRGSIQIPALRGQF
jgi:hypothetical protein